MYSTGTVQFLSQVVPHLAIQLCVLFLPKLACDHVQLTHVYIDFINPIDLVIRIVIHASLHTVHNYDRLQKYLVQ